MLPKRYRLRAGSYFQKAYGRPPAFRGRLLRVYVLRRPADVPLLLPRCAVIVSKKVHRLATRRNKLRRQLYQQLRQLLLQSGAVAEGLTQYRALIVVVNPQVSFDAFTFRNLQHELQKIKI